MEPFRFHLFVCTQQKPEGVVSCAASGSFAVLDALDRETQARGLDHDVQLTTCGCMGLCDEGPVMVVYPEGVWYRHVKPSDVAEIVGVHLRDGKAVERLVWSEGAAMKAMAEEHQVTVPGRDGRPRQSGNIARSPGADDPRLHAESLPSYRARTRHLYCRRGWRHAGRGRGEIHANGRAAGMLLNALVALGLLSKSGDDYQNTRESARFFVQGSKDNHRDGLLHTANIWHRWSTLTDAVRGGTRMPVDRDTTGMDTQLHCRDATPCQGSRPADREGAGHNWCSTGSRSRGRFRSLFHRVREGLPQCAMRDS